MESIFSLFAKAFTELQPLTVGKVIGHLLDILLVGFLTYKILVLLKGSRAIQLIRGLFLITISFGIISYMANQWGIFLTSNWIIRNLATMIIVAIPIVFQPELRRGLEYLGRGKPTLPNPSIFNSIDEIIKAVNVLSLKKIGSLIVIERQIGLKEYLAQGVIINSDINAELILSIFSQHSPLHDGAIIIKDNKIVGARCILPVSKEITTGGEEFGLRHRAALGISEETDCFVIIVSEENGLVSIAFEGKLIKFLSPHEIRDLLRVLYPSVSKS